MPPASTVQKTTFNIAKMDCPAEEQLIRLKLAHFNTIQALDFDINNRQLTVFHTGTYHQLFDDLNSLKLDTSLIASVAVANAPTASAHLEKQLLRQVLAINFFFFLLEGSTGILAHSMGLIADGLDMLADSLVYGLALFAVGRTATHQKNIARFSGYFQLALALFGFLEVIRRFVGNEPAPAFQTMIGISVLALIGNVLCLYLLQKSKSSEAHLQASKIFTGNDVIANLGVIVAGLLVYWTHSPYPDLVVGTAVFVLVAQGAFKILQLARS